MTANDNFSACHAGYVAKTMHFALYPQAMPQALQGVWGSKLPHKKTTTRFSLKKLHLISLGCSKTRVDSEVMLGLLQRHGWTLTPDPASADAILVNTCAFLQSSIEESIDVILECAAEKKRGRRTGRRKRLVVAGCLTSRFQNEMEDLKASLPEVDAFLTTHQLPDILRAIEQIPPNPDEDYFLARQLAAPQSYAYLKISEGCNRRCSFCTIPLIRGRQISRPIPSLVQEAQNLAEGGVRELVLVAQELTGYGTDISLKDGLLHLLDALENIHGIAWIRLLYAYPWNFPPTLIQRLGQGKILPYVDIPLQHISQHILDDMRRSVTQDTQDKLLRQLREVPGMTLRTSLIAGYPGETEKDVQTLIDWLEDIQFDRLGVFEFSPEPGTLAGDRPDQCPPEVRRERRDRIMAAQQAIHARKMAQKLGETLEILVDGPSPEHPLVLEGRYHGQAPEVDGQVYLSYEYSDQEPAKIGDFVKVKIVDTTDYDLLGDVIDEE